MRKLWFADNIHELRITNGYSQKFVSSYIHISRQTYSLYEKGERIPNIKTLCLLAELYGTSTDLLLYVDLSCSQSVQISDAPALEYASGTAENMTLSLEGAEARMVTNYRALPPEDQKEARAYMLFKKKFRESEAHFNN